MSRLRRRLAERTGRREPPAVLQTGDAVARRAALLELHEHVDIALGAEVVPRHRAKQRQPADVVPTAHLENWTRPVRDRSMPTNSYCGTLMLRKGVVSPPAWALSLVSLSEQSMCPKPAARGSARPARE